MTDRAAIDGDYADFKLVKTRGVAQFIVEIPIEQAAELVRLFGVPLPDKPVRVAVARLGVPPQIEARAETTAEAASGREHGPWSSLTPTLQSILRCQTPAFWKFLEEQSKVPINVANETYAATIVRTACGVNSRASLTGKAAEKWQAIDARYEAWLRTPQ